MNRCQDIFTDYALIQHDGVLIVVTLPRHISHEEVTTQSQFTVFGSITLSKDIALLHTLTFLTDRTKVNNHVLVRAAELRNAVFLQGRLEANELLILCTVIEDTDSGSIHIFNDAFAFSGNHGAAVFTNLLLNTGTNDRSFIMKQRNSLTHHVRSHQCTVSIIVLQERNKACCDRGYLLRSHVHQVNLIRSNNREVGILTALHISADE